MTYYALSSFTKMAIFLKLQDVLLLSLLLLFLSTTLLSQEQILFASSQTNEIYIANLDGSGTPTLYIDNAVSDDIVGIYADHASGLLYMNDGNDRETYTAPLAGGVSGTLLPNSSPPTGEHFAVYVDSPNDRYFFCVDEENSLYVANTNGMGTATKVITSGDIPDDNLHGLDYDPATDMAYVCGLGAAEGVWSVNVATGAATQLFDATDGVTGARGLRIDATAGKIYWAQHQGGGSSSIREIMVANLDGSGTVTQLYNVPSPFLPADVLLHVPSGKIYWSEFDTDDDSRIMVGNLDGSGSPAVLHTFTANNGGYMRGLAFAQPVEGAVDCDMANSFLDTDEDGDWSNPNNWSNGCVPDSPISVAISIAADVDLSTAGISYIVGTGGSLTISSGTTLNVDEPLTIETGGSIVNNGILNNSSTVTYADNFTNTGIYKGGGVFVGSFNNNGEIQVSE